MSNRWTSQQQKVIETKDHNVLVSAAAGSGKTAVLVERIVQRVTDTEHPVDIDRFVVVTFTNAAAQEMRERIRIALEQKMEESHNGSLKKQIALVHTAQITTIDSFCLNLLRNHYMKLDLAPGFRVADRGELELLKSDVMGALLEEYYQKHDSRFYRLVESYGGKKSDAGVEDLIRILYNASQSYPWQEEWLDYCLKIGAPDSVEVLDRHPAVVYAFHFLMKYLQSMRNKFTTLLEICEGEGGPAMYTENIVQDIANMDRMLASDSFTELSFVASEVTFSALGRKKYPDVDAQQKEYVKTVRTKYRDTFRKFSARFFDKSAEEIPELLHGQKETIELLVELTKGFTRRLSETKRDKNIIDFQDMEHFALDLLVCRTDTGVQYTELADELAMHYEEILIDEYQDSNMLQEQILTAVARGRLAGQLGNIFMVGDVKQSIYKFRLARPELFIEKYDTYPEREGCELIELRRNFRSRKEVLDSVNEVFFQIMQKEYSGIAYSEEVMLNAGFDFPQPDDIAQAADSAQDEICPYRTEIYLIDESSDEGELSAIERESLCIAGIVRKLTDEQTGVRLYDKKTGQYRTASYRDIVILTRSMQGRAETYANVLMNEGIPARAENTGGYYNTFEIELLLNLLAVIDNPLQDIPLVSVMTSYFGGMDLEEVACVRKECMDTSIYESLQYYVRTHSSEASVHATGHTCFAQAETDSLARKCGNFLAMLEDYRSKASYLSIQDFIWQICYETGYYDYVAAMPAGQLRTMHLDMLAEMADNYEKTSYHGLFNFLRYIDKLKKYDLDNSSLSVDGVVMDLVRIMTVHKSKGLEFPIVILAGMAKKFNQMDARRSICIDADLGIGVDIIDTQRRLKSTTPLKEAVALKIATDNLSEEMRILYVAMTRAEQKLIMTGNVADVDKAVAKWSAVSAFTFSDIHSCQTYLDMVMPVALAAAQSFDVIRVTAAALAEASFSKDTVLPPKLQASDMSGEDNCKEPEVLPYAYAFATTMKNKMSVSEIKHMEDKLSQVLPEVFEGGEEPEEFVAMQSDEAEMLPVLPLAMLGEEKAVHPTERGTAYHRVMECFDYTFSESLCGTENCMHNLCEAGLLTERQLSLVEPSKIYRFFQSSLGRRAKKAFEEGRLYREKAFVMSVPASQIKQYAQLVRDGIITASAIEGESVLVQGVIDLFFEEDGQFVLADYKTDKVSIQDGFKRLADRYAVQLDYYADALQRATGKQVKEKIIYSFALDDCKVL